MPNFIRTKQTIYISLGVLLLGVLVFAAFRFLAPAGRQTPRPAGERPGVISRLFGLPPTPAAEEEFIPNGQIPEGQIVGSPESRLVRLTDFSVVSPSLDSAGKRILVYKKSGGDLTAIDPETLAQEKVSNLTIVGILEAVWSPRRDRAAVFYLDAETLKGFLHIGTSSVAVLPQNIRGFSWSPTGNSLAYLLRQDDRLSLITADASGANASAEFRTPVLDSQVEWVTADKIAFQTAPSGLAEGFLFAFSRSRRSFENVLGPRAGLSAKWSPDGARFLASFTNRAGKNLELAVYDASGKELFRPGISTLAQKCVFADSDTAYCAVPRFMNPAWVLPDDYLRGEANTSDRAVKIDIKNRSISEIMDGGTPLDMSELILNPDKKILFFVNRMDGTLWMYRLE